MSTTYVDGSTPLDAAHMNALQQKVEKGITNGYASLDSGGKVPVAQIPLTVVGYGTSLPGSPVDGQEAILVDSITAPTYQWRMRYNAGSTSTYKWEFVGGTPARADADANEVASSATYGELTTQQRITVARAGVYEAHFGALTWGSITNAQGDMAIVDTTAPTTALVNMSTGCPTTNIAAVIHRERWIPGALTAGRTYAAVFRVGGASGTQNYAVRWFSLFPVRLS